MTRTEAHATVASSRRLAIGLILDGNRAGMEALARRTDKALTHILAPTCPECGSTNCGDNGGKGDDYEVRCLDCGTYID